MTTPNTSGQLASYLDRYLKVEELPDSENAVNGLQVENSGRLTRVLCAVDACDASVAAAVARGADFMVVHHGLFWDGLQPITGRLGRKIRALVAHDIALYAAHIPLDCHPEVGNNPVLAGELGLEGVRPFGRYKGIEIGAMGGLDVPLNDLVERVRERLGTSPRVIAKGPARTKQVAVVTGAASVFIAEAHERGIDTFITGEGPHHAFHDAEEWGLNVLFAGHYATETVGVQALGEHLRDRFGLPFEFFDHPTGL
jgi:dinuclear metal center YbgI/SA1388 family protein